jgi:putative ABC transport system substrate-binding protein
MKVDVLVAGGGRAAAAAKEATRTIPIVILANDPVGSGLVASLAKPGANITGLSHLPASWSKWLDLLKEAAPRLKRIAVLSDPSNPNDAHAWSELQSAAPRLSVTIERHIVRVGDDVNRALEGKPDTGEEGLFVPPDPVFLGHRKRIVELATRNRLPGMYGFREHVELGGLMAYAPSFPELFRRMATFVDKILKGRAPSDLPLEQPERFYLVINLKTAKALGLTLAPSLLLRADEVIP